MCEVCTEPFTLSIRRKVDCPYCEFSACAQCHARYLTGTTEYAHCMNCRKGWSREILVSQFTNVFVNKTYKQHRENTLFDRERSLMPETQPYVEIEKKCSELRRQKDQYDRLRLAIIRETVPMWHQMPLEEKIKCHRDYTDRCIRVREYMAEIAHIDFVIYEYQRTGPPREKRVFTRACPALNCKGFLSTAWKCGLCEVHVCSKCHEIKEEGNDNHVCDPNSVATAEMLARDSKPCPKCASIIFKIDGCDQMFCTQCHTAFSWRTGRVETGTIHNPHYYDYMRTRGALPRAPGDVLCGGLPDIFQYGSTISRYYPRAGSDKSVIYLIHRTVQHIQHVVTPRYVSTETVDSNRDLRVSYMMNHLSEDEFKHKIQKREKAENRKRDIREVLVMFTTVATDIFQRLVTTPNVDYIEELVNLRNYTDDVLDKVSKRWKCSVPRFVDWTMR
jgi:hypothetical protein